MLVILMGRSSLLVVSVLMLVIVGMAVRQIPVRMLMLMLDHGRRGFSP
jgi:hypothetical protein